jgi:hypothetical protein
MPKSLMVIPQGQKPESVVALSGTAKAVPFSCIALELVRLHFSADSAVFLGVLCG